MTQVIVGVPTDIPGLLLWLQACDLQDGRSGFLQQDWLVCGPIEAETVTISQNLILPNSRPNRAPALILPTIGFVE